MHFSPIQEIVLKCNNQFVIGVPTLLLSPRPLPKSWETPADDRKGLNMNTIENLNKVLRVFVTEYLHLTVYNI